MAALSHWKEKLINSNLYGLNQEHVKLDTKFKFITAYDNDDPNSKASSLMCSGLYISLTPS